MKRFEQIYINAGSVDGSPRRVAGVLAASNETCSNQPLRTSPVGWSKAGRYGLISSTGVPSTMSAPANRHNQDQVASIDLLSGQMVWDKVPHTPGVDRGDLTPEGTTLYLPKSECDPSSPYELAIDALTGTVSARIPLPPRSHDTVGRLHESRVFMETKSARATATMYVASTATNTTDVDRQRLASLVPDVSGVETKPMFGSVGPFVNANVFMGLFAGDVGVKLAEPDRSKLATTPGAGLFGPAERPVASYITSPADWTEGEAKPWIARAQAAAAGLPAKQPKEKAPKK